jgi:hypothetical protein
MAEDREQRISSALSSLIDKLVPAFEDEDDASFDERQLNALELARTILARCVCVHQYCLNFQAWRILIVLLF